ncbi:MAG: Holliday junction resolvase RuvX [Coriobacteriales bacterium]|jgi:putative Holliday junction resolvase|nr:Holliday junction resolvase RuvX [Coriobacteriales bacterium]
MRVLALDMGEKRVGVAVGDTDSKIAFPISTISTEEILAGGRAFRRLIEDYEPELLVVGLPLSLDGSENQQARHICVLAEGIAKKTGLPLVYQDERLSSAEARRTLREAGCTEREMRGKIDTIAASFILRAYLEALSSE